MKQQKVYVRISELWRALDKAGISTYSYAKHWIRMREKSGQLVFPPRDGISTTRKVTRKQIKEIIKAFSPGGSYRWHWKKRS